MRRKPRAILWGTRSSQLQPRPRTTCVLLAAATLTALDSPARDEALVWAAASTASAAFSLAAFLARMASWRLNTSSESGATSLACASSSSSPSSPPSPSFFWGEGRKGGREGKERGGEGLQGLTACQDGRHHRRQQNAHAAPQVACASQHLKSTGANPKPQQTHGQKNRPATGGGGITRTPPFFRPAFKSAVSMASARSRAMERGSSSCHRTFNIQSHTNQTKLHSNHAQRNLQRQQNTHVDNNAQQGQRTLRRRYSLRKDSSRRKP